jgi:DNA polymerase-4
MDAFYASVEQRDHPEYRGKPVIVGGLPGDRRSVVSTASYEARVFGVHSAMPVAQAVRLCPQGVFLRGRHRRYSEMSAQIMEIFGGFSPDVQKMSVDEAFIDITGTEGLFGPREALAQKLKERVRRETGLTVSVGGAGNKYVAKIASGMSKPDGLFLVPPGGEEDFMRRLPIDKIWGAGGKTQALFKRHGLYTCADIAALPLENLRMIFGKAAGSFLYRAVRGQAAEDFDREPENRSISAEHTFAYDLFDTDALESALLDICQDLTWRLIKHNWRGRTVFVKIRYGDFTTEGIQETSDTPVRTIDDFFRRVTSLFHKKYRAGQGVRLLGAGISGLEDASNPIQAELFPEKKAEKERKLEEAVFEINQKHKNAKVVRARTVKK